MAAMKASVTPMALPEDLAFKLGQTGVTRCTQRVLDIHRMVDFERGDAGCWKALRPTLLHSITVCPRISSISARRWF
jgi:hypothetical protein